MKRNFILTVLCLITVGLLSAKPIAPPEFDTPDKLLYFFVCSGNIEGIDAALAEGADINAIEKDSYPLLHISIFQENYEVFDHLLKKGADVHAFSNFGNCNALSLATIYDRREMVIKLLDAGADPNAAEVENYMKEYSAIAYAALYGHVDLLKLFAERGGDLEKPLRWPMWRGIPPEFPLLSVAAQHGGVEVVRYLVEERGHAVNPTGKIPTLPPLSVAVRYNNMEVAKYLISKGADVNAVGHDYYFQNLRSKYNSNWLSPLGVAARYNRAEMVKLLFAYGATIREGVHENNHPMYWADSAGYYKVIEAFEEEGYTFDYLEVLERRFKANRGREKETAFIENASDFTPTFLRGYARQWEYEGDTQLDSPLRLAVIADSESAEIADLLTVALSEKTHLELIERSALEEVLKEQELTRSGLTSGESLSLVSRLLDAQALVLIEKHQAKKKQFFQLRLVNSILGLQYGRDFIESKDAGVLASVAGYADTVGVLTNNFRRNYGNAIPISLVSVRSDLGTVDGLKIESTLKQLLELELLAQPSVILTQREDLEMLIREKDLGGRVEAFQASGIFVDLGVQLDASGKQPQSYRLRFQSASGESFSLELSAGGKALNESASMICRAIMGRIESKYTDSDFMREAALAKDAEAYFQEALWNFKMAQHAACLEPMRTAISLGYNKRPIWDYYYKAVQLLIDDRREHRGDDANNRAVLALERERLVALEGILKLYRSDVPGNAPRFGSYARGWIETKGIVDTFARFRPVAMQRRYAPELRSLERQFLRLINDFLVPCYAEPMPHGKRPDLRITDIFQAVDLMAQLEESEYVKALSSLMKASGNGEFGRKYGRPPALSNQWFGSPVAASRWEAAAYKFSDDPKYSVPSLERLRISYYGQFNAKWAPRPQISILDRQEISDHMKRSTIVAESDGGETKADALLKELILKRILGFDGPRWWWPQIGSVPQYFEYFDEAYEHQRIDYAVLVNQPVGMGFAQDFHHLATLKRAQETYEAALEAGKYERADHTDKQLKDYRERRDFLKGKLSDEEEALLGELPIRLWSLAKNGGAEFKPGSFLLHQPIIHEGNWVVIAAANGGSDHRLRNLRYALLKVDPETLKTEVRWLEHSLPGPRIKVAQAGSWLAMAREGRPIQMMNLDTFEMKELSNYIPTKATYTKQFYVVARGERFFFFVQPESLGYTALHGTGENSMMQILLRYDPDTDVSEVVYNTRRNPPENILDGTGNVYDVVGSDYGIFYDNAIVLSKNPGGVGAHHLVNAETLEIRRVNRKEEKALEQPDPNGFRRFVHMAGVSWSAVWPRIKKEELDKLPVDNISFALQYRERHEKGRSIRTVRKAVLPTPQKKDPSYQLYLERLARVNLKNYISARRHYFDENYGYLDYYSYYGRGGDVLWGIFRMSDLAEALEKSSEL